MGPHNRTRKTVQSLVTFLPNIITQCLFTSATGTDGPRGLCQPTAHKLTDDALLDIFDFYLNDDNDPDVIDYLNEWHILVHVCRRWRDLVFASPRRLNLRLLCGQDKPVRGMLDIWPPLPIEIHDTWMNLRTPDVGRVGPDNVIVALEHPDRVRSIHLTNIPSSEVEAFAAAMQVPFPELTFLWLWSDLRSTSVLPPSFLGGSAPRLRTLSLEGISFPPSPNLLLSASDLVDLHLTRLPHSGYISPEAMVAYLSLLNRLKILYLEFESPQSRPNQPNPPPQTRVDIPALTDLSFRGMTDYSEDFLAHIDTPVLDNFSMTFFLDLVFDVPHLVQFIGRAKLLKPPKVASVLFDLRSIRLELDPPRIPVLEIMCHRIDWQVDSMARVCGQLSPFCSPVEQLDFIAMANHSFSEPQGQDDMPESTEFLELFRPFTAVRTLRVSRSLVPLISTALQALVGPTATEVLPNLCDLFLGGSAMAGTVLEAMQPFLTARQLSGQPVAVHHWEGRDADYLADY